MQFQNLVIVNVSSVKLHETMKERTPLAPWIKCHAVSTDWGSWYKESPFNGARDIRFLSYGGMDVASVRLDLQKIMIRQGKYKDFKFIHGPYTELTEVFKFDSDTTSCDLLVDTLKIGINKDDSDQPFRLINYKGDTAPYGDQVEEWISPYMLRPNRPYLQWRSNPNRNREPIPR